MAKRWIEVTHSIERVLATVDWSHCVLHASGKLSGYAMDALAGPIKHAVSTDDAESQTSTRARTPSSGLFARYLRGDNGPSFDQLVCFDDGSNPSWSRFHHPVYRVIAGSRMDSGELVEILGDLAHLLHAKVFSADGRYGSGLWQLPATSRRLEDLAAQGDGYALAALLIYVRDLSDRDSQQKAMEAGKRAFQCMIFAFARGEFKTIRTVLAARIRQQVLDSVSYDGQALDTGNVDIEAGTGAVRQLLQDRDMMDPSRNSVARRQLFREVLDGKFGSVLQAVSPELVSIETALRNRSAHQRPTEMDSEPTDRFGHVRCFGRKASEVIRRALGDYFVDSETVEPDHGNAAGNARRTTLPQLDRLHEGTKQSVPPA